MINNRQHRLIVRLLQAGEPVQIETLAKWFDVSTRTIHSDLDAIDYAFKQAKLPVIQRIYKKGIQIQFNEEEMTRFSHSFSKVDGTITLRADERCRFILLLLLEKDDYVTIATLAEKLGVSRGTVLSDIARMRAECKGKPFSMESSRKGVRVEGEESAMREYLYAEFKKNADEACIYNVALYHDASIVNGTSREWGCEGSQYLLDAVRELENNLESHYTDDAFLRILSHIELSLMRSTKGRYVSVDQMQIESLFGTREFSAMVELSKKIGEQLGIVIPLEETAYLTIQLLGCRTFSTDSPEDTQIFADIQMLVCDLIESVGNEMKIDFSKDLSLYNDLVYHIRPTIFRLKNRIQVNNPLLGEVKKTYKSLFQAVQCCVSSIEKICGAEISEHEIGYLTIHFAAIIEKQRRSQKKHPRIVVVCNSGIGTSNLLSARLRSIYDVTIVATVAYHELEEVLNTHQVEYIISTIDIQHDRIPVIRVNPLIDEIDIQKLSENFELCYTKQIDVEYFLRIVEKYATITDEEGLQQALYGEFLNSNDSKEIEEGKMLKDVTNRNLIEVNYKAENWEQAVRESGRLLKEEGCTDDAYVEGMVDAVRTMGAYIVIGEGIALPHSRSAGASKVGVSILTLKSPVNFGHPENDPVDLVFGLSVIDNQSHLMALRDLSKVLSDEDKVSALRKAESTDEIMEIIGG